MMHRRRRSERGNADVGRFAVRPRGLVVLMAMLVCLFSSSAALAQAEPADPQTPANQAGDNANDNAPNANNPGGNVGNPLSVMDNAGEALAQLSQRNAANDNAGNNSNSASGEDAKPGLSNTLSIVLLLTVLSLAPSILVMATSFTRIIVVLALLRQAIGTQSLPPSQVITGLALFMTFLIMGPTFQKVNEHALVPLQNGQITEFQAWSRAKQPMRDFMFDQIEYSDNWESVYMILNYRGVDTSNPGELKRGDVDLLTLVPAFILSELKIAFLMGFRLYLPFLIIDMVVASVLISMGMMMLPPILISLPFKLLLFVMVDGWHLVVGNLMNSFAVPGVTT